MADFSPVIGFTLPAEGGDRYTNDPHDPGGPTRFGITLAGLSAYRKRRCSAADVQMMTQLEAVAIYNVDYWHPVGGPSLPAGLDLVVFDFGVNAGPVRSAQLLQRVLGLVQDGQVGPKTLAATTGDAATTRTRLTALANLHEAYYHGLPGFARYGRGWSDRVEACLTSAIRLAGGNAVPILPRLPKPRVALPADMPLQDEADALDNTYNPGA